MHNKNGIICNACHKSSHSSVDCFQAIGFPDWWLAKTKITSGQSSLLFSRGRHGKLFKSGSRRGQNGGRTSAHGNAIVTPAAPLGWTTPTWTTPIGGPTREPSLLDSMPATGPPQWPFTAGLHQWASMQQQ